MNHSKQLIFILFLISTYVSTVSAELKPIMTILKDEFFSEDFNSIKTIEGSEVLFAKDGTPWTVENQNIVGRPTSEEYQRSRAGHNGGSPQMVAVLPHYQTCVSFRIKWEGVSVNYRHMCRFGITRYAALVYLNAYGTNIVAGKGILQLMHDPDFKLEAGKWYDVMVEIFNNEMLVQFKDGPTLYGNHDSIWGKHGPLEKLKKEGMPSQKPFGWFGPASSETHVDDIKIWNVEAKQQEGWSEKSAKLLADYNQKFPTVNTLWSKKDVINGLKEMAEKAPNAAEVLAVFAKESDINKASKESAKKNRGEKDATMTEEQKAKNAERAAKREKGKQASREKQQKLKEEEEKKLQEKLKQ